MGKLLSLWRRVGGEKQLSGALGDLLRELAKQADEGVASAVAGLGLFGLGDTINIGENPDGSIVVNGDNIQVNPLLQSAAAAGAAAAPIVSGSDISVTGGFEYLTQAAWYVDATTGNDANDGSTPATALLTLRELGRRFYRRRLIQDTTVTLTGNFSEPLWLECSISPAFTLSVVGSTPTQTSTGSFTAAFVAYAAATNVDAKVTDSTQTWALRVGQRIRMTSGASSGAIAWVMKDLGANVARVSQFVNRSTGAAVVPANGDSYVTETVSTILAGFQCDVTGGGAFTIKDIESNMAINASHMLRGTSEFIVAAIAKLVKLDGCVLRGNVTHSFRYSGFFLVGCLSAGSTAGGLRFYFSEVQLYGHCSTNFISAQVCSRVSVQVLSVAQAGGFGCFNQSIISLAADALGVFDSASFVQMDVEGGVVTAAAAAGILFGTGNTATPAVRFRSGSYMQYTTKPVITGAATDALVGGTARTWAQIPYIEPANNAMIVARA